jgi:tRNA(Ile)-lysidine synthase
MESVANFFGCAYAAICMSSLKSAGRARTVVKLQALEMSVQRTLIRYRMLEPGDHVLVSVSGGADSTGLLLCLRSLAPKLGFTVSVAHLNHRIRGTEADQDEEFVKKLCAELQVPVVSETQDVRRDALARKQNLEESAREARYRFLREVAGRVGARKIALGHTLNDQAETVLMRLVRGSGNDGITAMSAVREGLFIRPFLETSRQEIVAYLKHSGVSYREDSTNSDLQLKRNRIRHELIPYLNNHLNPKVVEALARYARTAQEIGDYLHVQTQSAFEEVQTGVPGGISLSVEKLLSFHPAVQKNILRHAVKHVRGSLRGIGMRTVQDLLLLCRPGSSGRQVKLPEKLLATRQFDQLLFLDTGSLATAGYSHKLRVPGQIHVPEIGVEFQALVVARALPRELNSSADQVYLDADALPGNLVIRSRRSGDRYGGPGRRKVKKMLIDARIPLQARAALPMLASGNIVLWIPGFAPAPVVAVQAKTTRQVVLKMTRRRL